MADRQTPNMRICAAILAGLIEVAAARAQDALPPPVDAEAATSENEPTGNQRLPMRVQFRLRDDVRVTGELTAFDDEGIDGSFGRRAWSDLRLDDHTRLFERLMDKSSASAWAALGRSLLLRGKEPMERLDARAKDAAERALRRAIELDPSMKERVAELRAEVQAILEAREAARQAAEAQRLSTTSPEAATFPADPWPTLTPAQQAEAVMAMREGAETLMQQAGVQFVPVESDAVLIYTDAPRADAAKWAVELDKLPPVVASLIGIPSKSRLTHGKIVVFVFTERDRFELVEAQVFNRLVNKSTRAVCHFDGPRVTITAFSPLGESKDDLLTALGKEVVHGLMHGHVSALRLPPWANEGLAAHATAVWKPKAPVVERQRKAALEAIRGGANLSSVLTGTYEDAVWAKVSVEYDTPEDRAATGIGALMVEFMIRERRAGFAKWVQAVKEGEGWRDAVRSTMGVSYGQIAETFVQYYRVND